MQCVGIHLQKGQDMTVPANNELSGSRQFRESRCYGVFIFFYTEATLQVLCCLNSFDTDI